MDWDRAKNLTIIFMLLLNIFLGVLIYIFSEKYVLNSEQETNIIKVLSQNNIAVYTEIPKSYRPMNQILMSTPEYNMNLLIDILFEEQEAVRQTIEMDKIIFKDDVSELTLQNNFITFTSRVDGITTREEARRYARNIIDKASGMFNGFEFHGSTESENGILLEYYQRYGKSIIYSNYLKFFFSTDGRLEINFFYNPPDRYEDDTIKILSADEALFLLMGHINDMNYDVFITGIDIVYYQDTLLKAVPYYRIYVLNKREPVLVNAVTGIVKNHAENS